MSILLADSISIVIWKGTIINSGRDKPVIFIISNQYIVVMILLI